MFLIKVFHHHLLRGVQFMIFIIKKKKKNVVIARYQEVQKPR